MTPCPQCHSTDVESNKLPIMPIGQIASGAIVARRSHWFSETVSQLLVWTGIAAANGIRPDWRCHYCDHRFNG